MATKEHTGSAPAVDASSAPVANAAPRNNGNSPDKWAEVAFPMKRRGDRSSIKVSHPSYWQHRAAAALHGWAEHAHHTGKPMQLTAEQYYAALVAASTTPARNGEYVPHFPALSPHASFARRLAQLAS